MRALPTTHTGWLAGDPRRKTTPVPGVRARCARARRSRAVFRLPVGAARHAKAAVPPRAHFRYGSGDSRAEALRPRRGGRRDAVSSFTHPWTGRRRLWPKANRRRRWGSRGHSPLRLLSPISCPYKKWGRPPGRDPAAPPLHERHIQNRRRSAADKYRRSLSGTSNLIMISIPQSGGV